MSTILDALLDALAVLSPVNCAGCEAPDRSLCAGCRREMNAGILTPRILDSGLTVLTALRYEGIVRRTLLAFKASGRTDVAPALAVPFRLALQRGLSLARSACPQGTTAPLLVGGAQRSGARRPRG